MEFCDQSIKNLDEFAPYKFKNLLNVVSLIIKNVDKKITGAIHIIKTHIKLKFKTNECFHIFMLLLQILL